MNCLVLSGTTRIVPSGTRSSCYRGPESTIHLLHSKPCGGRNFSNLDSYGIFLTHPRFCSAVDSLTVDVTVEQRGRIKIAAFQRGITIADMLRELFAREYPATSGDPS